MEQDCIIARLIEITIPGLPDDFAGDNTGEAVVIFEYLSPDLIDKTTDTLWEFIDTVKQIKRDYPYCCW